ncbi:hypothetical protein C8R45DRAFT_260230 [Mycena sanguinolenta]|nr:hypothetical protein C8R45DRAFT_260230 [Mycena sanguinolenta]
MHAVKFLSLSTAIFLLAFLQGAISQETVPVPLGGQCGTIAGTVCMKNPRDSFSADALYPNLCDSSHALTQANAATFILTMESASSNAPKLRPESAISIAHALNEINVHTVCYFSKRDNFNLVHIEDIKARQN